SARQRQTGIAQSRGRQVLVYARLQSQRWIQHSSSCGLNALQGIHAKDDLLQGAGRHGPHQNCLERMKCSGLIWHGRLNATEIDQCGAMSKLTSSTLQVARVPTVSASENAKMHEVRGVRSAALHEIQYAAAILAVQEGAAQQIVLHLRGDLGVASDTGAAFDLRQSVLALSSDQAAIVGANILRQRVFDLGKLRLSGYTFFRESRDFSFVILGELVSARLRLLYRLLQLRKLL